MSASAVMAPLREELQLHRGPNGANGSPVWVLEDPGRDTYFQIGWLEAEMVSRWHLRHPERIAADISTGTTLHATAEQVVEFGRFLERNSLVRDAGAVARFMREVRGRTEQTVGKFLLRNYLFFRIPLVNPDAFLLRTLPVVERLFFTRLFVWLTMASATLGGYLVTRQWDAFRSTFLHFFSLEGAALAAVTMAGVKIIHELGHAYTARRYGCPIPGMGVAFMVLVPLLYTDTSSVWRLRCRRHRLHVCAAGMLAELCVAAWATLLWNFLPDGPLRSAVFILATTTWIMTVAVNLSPLMRFDGYFLLSDALAVPNLQTRAFALARWRLRECLFGFGDEKPEIFEPWRERVLVVYAFCTWIYRFFLFTGIALVVYHMFFKLLGIFLFFVEVGVFVMVPVVREIKEWLLRMRGSALKTRGMVTLCLLGMLCGVALVPWHGEVSAPALLQAGQHVRLVAPVGAQLVAMPVAVGDTVARGASLFLLRSPELEQEISRLRSRLELLQWRISFLFMRRETAADVPVAQQERQAAMRRLALLERQQLQMRVVAPFAGSVVDIAEPLEEGEWVAAGEWLGTVTNDAEMHAIAYVDERDLHRLSAGANARFIPEDPDAPSVELVVEHVAHTASRHLAAAPELASPNGGAIAAMRASSAVAGEFGLEGGVWVPEQAVYRMVLRSLPGARNVETGEQGRVLRGSVVIDAERQSFATRTARYVLAVFLRESGF